MDTVIHHWFSHSSASKLGSFHCKVGLQGEFLGKKNPDSYKEKVRNEDGGCACLVHVS